MNPTVITRYYKIEKIKWITRSIALWYKNHLFLFICIELMCMIYGFSSQSATESSIISGSVEKYLSNFNILNIILTMIPIRKIAHFTLYALLGEAIFTFIRQNYVFAKMQTYYIFSFMVAVIYAITDECHQIFINGRSAELKDVLIDASGCTLALIMNYIIMHLLSQHKYNRERTNNDT